MRNKELVLAYLWYSLGAKNSESEKLSGTIVHDKNLKFFSANIRSSAVFFSVILSFFAEGNCFSRVS